MTLYPTYFLACDSKNSNRISGASSSKNTQRHVPAFQPAARSSCGETPAPSDPPPPPPRRRRSQKKKKKVWRAERRQTSRSKVMDTRNATASQWLSVDNRRLSLRQSLAFKVYAHTRARTYKHTCVCTLEYSLEPRH